MMKVITAPPRKEGYQALLTDLDGTLIRSEDAICDALFECFGHVNAKVPAKDEILSIFGLPVEVMLMQLGGVEKTEQARIDAFIAEYKRQYPIHMAKGAKLIPMAKETMWELHQKGIEICLITSERKSNAQFILKTLGLSPAVGHIISRDDVQCFKPHPEPILNACALLGEKPEDCVYIGESPYDIEAGVKAGAFVVAVGSGGWSVESLLECHPHVLVSNISELKELF